jgi:hypothetical protein
MVVLGHGGFNTGSFETLVPPDTTLRFFADAGSNLMLPFKVTGPALPDPPHWVEGQNWVFDYERVADVLANFNETEKPLSAGAVVYNMLLQRPHPDSQKVANDLDAQGKWGGELMMKTDTGEWNLCHGDPSTCPTPKLHVAESRHKELTDKGDAAVDAFKKWLADGAAGDLPAELPEFAKRLEDVPKDYYEYVAEGVPDARWTHKCGGILDAGAGYDIFWVACSGFAVDQDALDAIGLPEGLPSQVTATTAGPGRDWTPNDAMLDRISALNAEKVKDAADGASLPIKAGGVLVLIGEGHEADPANYVRRQGDFSEGTIKVAKGGAFSKGGIKVSGISGGSRDLVKMSIGLFSDKKVTFE